MSKHRSRHSTIALRPSRAKHATAAGKKLHVWEPPPALPIRYVHVRPKNHAVVYSMEGPIPDDQITSVPISPGIINAIKAGDLEEFEEAPEAQATRGGHHHRAAAAAD